MSILRKIKYKMQRETPEEKWIYHGRPMNRDEVTAINKHFSENMMHNVFVGPVIKKKVLVPNYKNHLRQYKITDPADQKLYKKAMATAERERWYPYLTYQALKIYQNMEGGEKKLKEVYDRARANKTELFDQILMEKIKPEEKESAMRDAKKYGLDFRDVARFNHEFGEIDPKIKDELFRKAKESKKYAGDVLRELAAEEEKERRRRR